MKRTLGALAALACALVIPATAAPLDFRLLYGSQVAGQIEPCG